MKLAIQEDLLPGRTIRERCQQARDLGFAGIEFQAQGLEARLYEVAAALDAAELRVSAVHLGALDGYLSPELEMREAAIAAMRQAMATAVDLQAEHVVFVPQWGVLTTPNLTPYRSSEEMASELMIWLLRTVSDLAYALGVTLDMQPRHRYHTHFMNTMAQAVRFSDEIKNHPHVRIAPVLFDLALEEADPAASLRQYGDRIGYLYLSDSNGRLPGQGLLNFGAVAQALREHQYEGWLCVTAEQPATRQDPYALYDALPDSLQHLRHSGLG